MEDVNSDFSVVLGSTASSNLVPYNLIFCTLASSHHVN